MGWSNGQLRMVVRWILRDTAVKKRCIISSDQFNSNY